MGKDFGQDTKAVYKSLQKNTSTYTPQNIETLKTAISITASRNQYGQGNQFHGNSYRGRPFPRGRGRGRGFPGYNSGYNQRNIPYETGDSQSFGQNQDNS